MITQGERITKLEQMVLGNGTKGLAKRLDALEAQHTRMRTILIAILVAASLGGVQGIMTLIERAISVLL